MSIAPIFAFLSTIPTEKLKQLYNQDLNVVQTSLNILSMCIQGSGWIPEDSFDFAKKVFSALPWIEILQTSNLALIKTTIFATESFLKQTSPHDENDPERITSCLNLLKSHLKDQERPILNNLLDKSDTCTDQELNYLVELVGNYYTDEEALTKIKPLRNFNFSPDITLFSNLAKQKKYHYLSYLLENRTETITNQMMVKPIILELMVMAIKNDDITLIDILSLVKVPFNIAFISHLGGILTTPLLLAICQGSEKMIRHLVGKGADINFHIKGQINSPLFVALTRSIEILTLILNLGGKFQDESTAVTDSALSGKISGEQLSLLFDEDQLNDFHFDNYDHFFSEFNKLKNEPMNYETVLIFFSVATRDFVELKGLKPLISAIRDLSDEEQADYVQNLLSRLSTQISFENFNLSWNKIYSTFTRKNHNIIPSFLLHEILKRVQLTNEEIATITSRLDQKEVGQPAIWIPLIKALYIIAKGDSLICKERVLNLFLGNKPTDLITTASIFMACSINDNALKEFESATSVDELKDKFIPALQNALGLNIENFYGKYLKNISSMRIPEALPFWIGDVANNLPNDFLQAVDYFRTIVEGQEFFSKRRYDLETSPHLKFIEDQQPGLIQSWSKGTEKVNVAELFNSLNIPQEYQDRTALDYCKSLLLDQLHLPLSEKVLPLLKSYLEKKVNVTREDCLSKLSNAIKQCQIEIKKEESLEKGLHLKKQRSRLKLEHFLITFADPNRKIGYDEKSVTLMKQIAALVDELYPNSPFQKDLKDFLIKKPKHSLEYYQNLTIEDTDNYQDLFFCGTEVKGSCLSFTGQPRINIALISIGLNGHVRIIPIKDSRNGKIVDRALHTLKIDNKGKPTLYLEEYYPQPVEDKLLNEIIKAFAIQRAKNLGLPLYSKAPNMDEKAHFELLEVKKSLIPYIYEDAIGGNSLWTFPLKHPRGNALYIP